MSSEDGVPFDNGFTKRSLQVSKSMHNNLTHKQACVLTSIKEYFRTNMRPPTIREISDMNGISSTNGTRGHLLALQRKGYLDFTPRVSRGLIIKQQEPVPEHHK